MLLYLRWSFSAQSGHGVDGPLVLSTASIDAGLVQPFGLGYAGRFPLPSALGRAERPHSAILILGTAAWAWNGRVTQRAGHGGAVLMMAMIPCFRLLAAITSPR